MGGVLGAMVEDVARRRRAWRRAHNARAGSRAAQQAGRPVGVAPPVQAWCVALLVLGGAILIASHARLLGARVDAGPALAALGEALPGIVVDVPDSPAARLSTQAGGALLVLSRMDGLRPVVVDLCAQMLDARSARLTPVRIGARFDEVARWAVRNEHAASPVTLRNVVLAAGPMPRVEIGGVARDGRPLRLAWHGDPSARWIGDTDGGAIVAGAQGEGEVALARAGWLVWGDAEALRVARRASPACPQAGELVLTRYHAAPGRGSALVAAFPRHGGVRTASLAPGAYRLPAASTPTPEDGALFAGLQRHGLVRLDAGGAIAVAPRDLPEWRRAASPARAADLGDWSGARLDADGQRLLARLYTRADGAYVREQIRISNDERRLLAWRLRPGPEGNWQMRWQMSGGGVAAAVSSSMPEGTARLFARLPEGWGPWRRVRDWPPGAGLARLRLTLAQPARGGEQLELLLAGRVLGLAGASLVAAQGVCEGRACRNLDDVRVLHLQLAPGARALVIDAGALAPPASHAAHRHLVREHGQLRWQALPRTGAPAPAVRGAVLLADRHGAALWADGRASEKAAKAGLAGLLGVDARHGGSVAGMLARLPQGEVRPRAARLTLDLGLQHMARQVLDCVGLRRGGWDGRRCQGGSAPLGPSAARQAGLVVLDTGSGDILAAAGAGPAVAGAAWDELADFEHADPARSPLRQPALQHDGGAERSPGSTFKIVTALGLELAAQRDAGRAAGLDGLLDGMALEDINALAAARGYAFRTDAPSYPQAAVHGGAHARISNFRDQGLDRRARAGRLGLSEALTHSLNTWFAWTYELSDASLLGRAAGGVPSLRALDGQALGGVRPVLDMARRLGFERPLRLDGGLLPADYPWRDWDALAASSAGFDPIGSRHELRQMAIGLRMQATPLHMAMVAGAVGEGRAIVPRLLLDLDGREAAPAAGAPLGVRLDRVRAGLQGVVARGTAAQAFRDPAFDVLRTGLYGKTGTAPVGTDGAATVWFTGWLEPGSIPGERRRLAFAVFVSRSEANGGEHAAPVVAALLRSMMLQ